MIPCSQCDTSLELIMDDTMDQHSDTAPIFTDTIPMQSMGLHQPIPPIVCKKPVGKAA